MTELQRKQLVAQARAAIDGKAEDVCIQISERLHDVRSLSDIDVITASSLAEAAMPSGKYQRQRKAA